MLVSFGFEVIGVDWTSVCVECLECLECRTGHVVTLMDTVRVVKTVECAGQFVTVLWQLVM